MKIKDLTEDELRQRRCEYQAKIVEFAKAVSAIDVYLALKQTLAQMEGKKP